MSTASLATPAARRELARRYKEAPPPPGVYAIRNLADQRVLVGVSTNPDGALNRHRFELQRGQHRNAQLQADWRRHGEAGFRLEVLDRLKMSDDPAFDAAAELEALLSLWREELGATAAAYPVRRGNPFA